MRHQPFLAVMKNHPFRSLWLGQVFSQIAINMMAFVLILRIYETTKSNTAVSILVLCIGLPAVFLGMLAGTLVDRWDKRSVLIATNLIRMILILGFFVTSASLFWVYVLVLGISASTQFFVPAEAPTIPKIVNKDLLLTANSLFTFTYYTSVMFGFILSGPALRLFGPHNVFLFLALLLAVAAYFVAQIPKQETAEKVKIGKEDISQVWQEFKNGLEFIKSRKEILQPILLLTASQALIACLAALSPGFAHKVLHVKIKDASYVLIGPAALGMVLGSLLVGHFGAKISKKKLINLGIILGGVLLLGLAGVVRYAHVLVAMMAMFSLGVANALIDVPANTVLQEKAPEEVRGRVYGVLTAFVGGAAILPVILTGLAADLFGVGTVILTMGLLILSYGIFRIIKL